MELTDTFQKIGTGDTVVYGGSAGRLELWAKYNSKDVTNNRTNVTVELRLVIDYGYIGNYQATYWSISGDLSNSGNLGSGDYRSRTLGSATGNITHNADGTKSVSFSGSFNPTAWGYSMGVSGSATLPNLHKPPVINAGTMVETNSVLTALNVPDTTVVRYLSKKKITVNATAYDGATLTYKIRHLNTEYTIPESGYQSSNVFDADYTQNNIILTSNNKAQIIQEVKDSLNGTASDYLFLTINDSTQMPDGIPYTKPSIERTNTSIKRKSGGGTTLTDNKAVLNLKATFYKANDVIGNNNSIAQIGYKIWEKGTTEPTNYTTLSPTISGGNITITNFEISNLIYTKTYNYKIILRDIYGYEDAILDGTLPTGQSVWTEYKDRVDFLNITIEGKKVVANDDVGKTATAWLSKDFSFSANYTYKIPFDNFETEAEGYFELYDNGIKVLKDCVVQVWLQWTTWGSYTRYAYIVLNNAEKESFVSTQSGTVATYMTLRCKSGDIIYGKCHAEGANGMFGTKNQSYIEVTILK